MKKRFILYVLLSVILFLIGCENIMNTPTNKVEDFFHKYQNLDKDVLMDLNRVLEKDISMNEEQKELYIGLLKKQYQNLSYKIKEETIIDNHSTIECEIEVLDYEQGIKRARDYYNQWLMENSEENNDSKFLDMKLEEMGKIDNKIKYSLTISLEKKEGMWEIENLSDVDRKKIHGLY